MEQLLTIFFPSLNHLSFMCEILERAVFADNSVTKYQVIFTLPVKIHTTLPK